MKRKLIKASAIFLLLMILFTVLSRAAYNMGAAIVETVQPVRMEMGPEVKAQGVVEQKQEIAVVTEANQLVKTVYVEAGQAVEADQVLFALDLKELEDQIQKKSKELELADLQMQSAQNAVQSVQSNRELSIQQAQDAYEHAAAQGDADVQTAEQELIQAQEQYEQDRASQDVSEEQLDALSLNLQGKQEAYDAAVKNREESLYAAQKSIDAANAAPQEDTSSIEQARISKEQIEAELKKLETLKNTNGEVKAPEKGIVTEISVKPGARTSGGGDVLLADLSAGTKLTAVFPEKSKQYIQRGEPVKLSSSSIEQKEFKDKLAELTIDAISENKGEDGGIAVTVNLPAETFDIGASVTMEVSAPAAEYETCVPLKALNMGEKGKYYVNIIEKTESVLGEGWVVFRTNVELLDKDEKYAAVEGITNTQEVITESSKILENKTRVKRKAE